MEGFIAQIFWAYPVQCNIRKWCLRAPSRWRIEPEDEVLEVLRDVFFYFLREILRTILLTRKGHAEGLDIMLEFFSILMHEGSEIRIERGKCLRSCPLILEDSEEINHLIHRRLEILRRGRLDLIRDTVKPLFEEHTKTPTGTVSCEHPEIMDVIISISVGISDFL